MQNTFLYISLLHDYKVKFLMRRFVEDFNGPRRLLLSRSKLGFSTPRIQFWGNFLHLTFKRMKIIAKKFEKTRRLLKSDVLLSSPSSFLGLPNFETPERLISTHFAQNFARFTNITGKAPTLLTSIRATQPKCR